jgi:hypothetical protein
MENDVQLMLKGLFQTENKEQQMLWFYEYTHIFQ